MNDEKFKIALFIQQFKQCYHTGRINSDELNSKTTKFLAEVGMPQAVMQKYIVDHISVANYHLGPSPHHRFPQSRQVMIFSFSYNQYELYVKIELITYDNQIIGGFMSFHPQEHPMTRPYAQNGGL